MDLFVAGLPFDISKEELQEMFEEFGTVVSAKIINDLQTGKSRGFGLISMPDAQQAEQAIKDINGSSIEGRTLTVKLAENKQHTFNNRANKFSSGNNNGGYNRDRN